eukprot:Gb_05482 [translate_table: standard]
MCSDLCDVGCHTIRARYDVAAAKMDGRWTYSMDGPPSFEWASGRKSDQLAGVCQVSSDWCLEVTLQWMPVEFPSSPLDLQLRLARQCLQSPCHWTPVYEQDSCLRFREAWRFEGMRPFISRFRGRVRSPCVYRVLGVSTSAWALWS